MNRSQIRRTRTSFFFHSSNCYIWWSVSFVCDKLVWEIFIFSKFALRFLSSVGFMKSTSFFFSFRISWINTICVTFDPESIVVYDSAYVIVDDSKTCRLLTSFCSNWRFRIDSFVISTEISFFGSMYKIEWKLDHALSSGRVFPLMHLTVRNEASVLEKISS